MADIVLAAVPRAQTGKVNRLRREGFVPAILYGHGQSPLSLAVDAGVLAGVLRTVSSSTLLTLTVSGDDARRVLIQEVQHHPLTGDPVHIDFHQVNLTEKIRVNVPVRAVGVSPAVRDLGGVLVQSIAEIEVEALPQDLPKEIAMDLSALATFEQRIIVADLPIPPKVEVHARSEDVVAVVSPPRTEKEIEELTTAVEEKAGEVKTEGDEKKAAEDAKKAAEEPSAPVSKSEKNA